MGEFIGYKLKKAISKSKNVNLDKFIYSIGIRHIGQENAKVIADFFGSIDELSNLFNNKKRKEILINLIELDGIGETQINSLENFFSNEKNIIIVNNLMRQLNISNFSFKNNDGKFSNKKLMFTGGFQNLSRSEAKAIVEQNGGKVLGTVSKKLDILVVGDSKPTRKN